MLEWVVYREGFILGRPIAMAEFLVPAPAEPAWAEREEGGR
jgi:hypothetical protein